MTRLSTLSIIAFSLYTLGIVYGTLAVILQTRAPLWLLNATTLAFFIFAVTHASWRFGTRTMLIFLALTFVVSFIFETLGVLTGIVYGPYAYTEKLGPKLGVVPLLIPLAWFMMMYASYTVVDIIASPAPRPASRAWRAWVAWLGAMAMTAWDLGMDPQMVAGGHWIWTQSGAYFGVPVRNFIGWLATTGTVFALFHIVQARQPARPFQFGDAFAYLPVIAYALQGSATLIVGVAADQRAPALITFFAMGAFLFAAITRIAQIRGQP